MEYKGKMDELIEQMKLMNSQMMTMNERMSNIEKVLEETIYHEHRTDTGVFDISDFIASGNRFQNAEHTCEDGAGRAHLLESLKDDDTDASSAKLQNVWEIIVNNDDITLTHIFPKLNLTDKKFLHMVNREARALVKRAVDRNELRETSFKFSEMSISTLKFAWKNSEVSDRTFCRGVVQTNNLEFLKWALEERHWPWNWMWKDVTHVKRGNLEILKYYHVNGRVQYPHETGSTYNMKERCKLCTIAAGHGHLHCLKYLVEVVKVPLSRFVLQKAHTFNKTDCIEYLIEKKCPGWNKDPPFFGSSWSCV